MKKYESPKINFKSIMVKEQIANPCWSPNSYANQELYYDYPGAGYIKFKASGNGNNCGQAVITILEYYNFPMDKQPSQDELLLKVQDACGGGNSGNPYKSKGSDVTPDDPSGTWS